MDLLNARLTKLQQDYQNQIDAADALANENQNKAADLKVSATGCCGRVRVQELFHCSKYKTFGRCRLLFC